MAEPKMNYSSNSHKKREAKEKNEEEPQEKRVERITARPAQRKKPSWWSRVGGDTESIGQYLVFEIVVPAAKSMLVELFSQGAERAFYGENYRGRSSGGRTNYNAASREPSYRSGEPRQMSSRSRANHDFQEIVIPSRAETEEVIDRMYYMIQKYDVCTVNDLYDMVGITGTFVDDKWGWGDLPFARPKRVRTGYLLDIPRPEPID